MLEFYYGSEVNCSRAAAQEKALAALDIFPEIKQARIDTRKEYDEKVRLNIFVTRKRVEWCKANNTYPTDEQMEEIEARAIKEFK